MLNIFFQQLEKLFSVNIIAIVRELVPIPSLLIHSASLKIAQNHSESLQIASNCFKSLQIASNPLKIAQNRSRAAQNLSKPPKAARNLSTKSNIIATVRGKATNIQHQQLESLESMFLLSLMLGRVQFLTLERRSAYKDGC